MNASTQATRTFTTRKGRTVESDLTNLEAIERVGKLESRFARSLYAHRERLSAEQLAWCHVLAMESRQPRPEPPRFDFAGISALFDNASQHLKRPSIELVTSDGVAVSLTRNGARSRYPGSISVDNQTKKNRRHGVDLWWYGRINRDGSSELSSTVPASVVELLVEFSAHPAEVAARCGKLLGRCCFCGSGLTDERSTHVGYGPVCAKRYGLSWGEKGAGHEHEHEHKHDGAQGAAQAPQAVPQAPAAEATLEPVAAEQELLQDANALLEAVTASINEALGVQVACELFAAPAPALFNAPRFTFQKQLF
jgi:hypothetical protein